MNKQFKEISTGNIVTIAYIENYYSNNSDFISESFSDFLDKFYI